MARTTRRNFLQASALVGIGTTVLPDVALAAKPQAAPAISGKLVAVGFGAKRASHQPMNGTSAITELDLGTGNVKTVFVPLAAAHSLLSFPNGASLCLPLDGVDALWVDADYKPGQRLAAPEGYLFSGHGVIDRDQRLAYISLRRRNARSFSDTGLIGIIDAKTNQMVGTMDSGGVRPHDLALDGQHLIISHYGDINYEKTGQTSQNVRQPRLVTIDVRTRRIIQSIDTPNAGSLTHLAIGEHGQVCGVPLSYQGYDPAGRHAVEEQLGGKSFELSVAEELEGRIGSPMPILLIDRTQQTVQSVIGTPEKQRRAQSVAYHQGSKRFFVTYSFSDTLACVDAKGVSYVSAFDLGLSYVRGVCPVGNTGLIAVTGEFRGVALLDARSLKVVKRIDVAWYGHPHVVSV